MLMEGWRVNQELDAARQSGRDPADAMRKNRVRENARQLAHERLDQKVSA